MDFSVAPPQQITREFLAVVLAGFGNECVVVLRLVRRSDLSLGWFL